MDPSQVINLAALGTALVAVVASSALSARAIRMTHNSNHVQVTLSLLAAQRTGEFFAKEKRLWDDLPTYDSNLGFMNLPESIRSDVIDIGLYYHALAYISEYGFADRDFMIVQTKYRMLRTWKTIKPFVDGERRLRGGLDTFMNAYELFVADAERLDIAETTEKLLAGGRWWRRRNTSH